MASVIHFRGRFDDFLLSTRVVARFQSLLPRHCSPQLEVAVVSFDESLFSPPIQTISGKPGIRSLSKKELKLTN